MAFILKSSRMSGTVLTTLCGFSLAAGFFMEFIEPEGALWSLSFYIIAYASGGYIGLLATIHDLKQGEINIDFLMITAAIGAAIIDQWLEGAILLFLFSLSGALESYALGKSRTAIHSLMELRPSKGLVRQPDGSEEFIPVEELKVGQIVIVKPGEYIPIDGKIIRGFSDVDQSAITGESIPVSKKPGDNVFAATLNEQGAIEIEVTKPSKDTTLAKIIELVEKAQKNKAQTQRFLERFEPGYAISVVVAVILLVLIPWQVLNHEFEPVFYRAMTVLVVASPCALIISTPASIISAIANAARNGILFKGGAYIEQTIGIDTIALDKTGTLTEGRPVVTDILPFGNGISGENGKPMTEEELMRLAAGCELYSEHHLGEAIVNKAREKGWQPAEVHNLQAVPGQGIHAEWDSKQLSVGNQKLFETIFENWPSAIKEKARQLKEHGKTVVFLVTDGQPYGIIALADQLRPEAAKALQDVRAMGIKKIVMLTGDNEEVANDIARKLDIDEVHANLLPDQKLVIIEKLKSEGSVAMVGDGVNDAPALATSNLGIAMGAAGTDVALETADVVLMGDDLSKLPYLFWLSGKSKKIVWQNIGFSLAVIVMLLAGVFLIDLPLTAGVIGHEGSTLLVVLNGLRLLKTGSLE
jgi:Zn2+/Cd2+-exporting ATPase